jgi:hypothetical protein
MQANKRDCEEAKVQVDAGKLSGSLFKRLSLEGKYESLLSGVLDVDKLDDPTGKITLAEQLDEGLELYRVTCPVGVLLIIFEARMNNSQRARSRCTNIMSGIEVRQCCYTEGWQGGTSFQPCAVWRYSRGNQDRKLRDPLRCCPVSQWKGPNLNFTYSGSSG